MPRLTLLAMFHSSRMTGANEKKNEKTYAQQ